MLFLFLLAGLVGGTSWILVPIQLKHLPFEFAVAYRFALSGVFLLIISLLRDRAFPKITTRQNGLLMLQGALFFSINHILCYISSRYMPTGFIAISVSLMVIPNAIMGYVFFREHISRSYILGVLLGLIGVVLAFSQKGLLFSMDASHLKGFTIAFCSTFFSAVGTVLSKKIVTEKFSVLWMIAIGSLYGSLFSFLLGIWAHGEVVFSFTREYLMVLLYVSIVTTSFVTIVYFLLVEKQGASRASYLWLITPIISMLMSQIFEGLQSTVFTWGGLFLVIGGLYLCINKNKGFAFIFDWKKKRIGARKEL